MISQRYAGLLVPYCA